MTHLSREKREELPTYRVMSDNLETYYGRIQKDVLGNWEVLPSVVPRAFSPGQTVTHSFKSRADAVKACVSAYYNY